MHCLLLLLLDILITLKASLHKGPVLLLLIYTTAPTWEPVLGYLWRTLPNKRKDYSKSILGSLPDFALRELNISYLEYSDTKQKKAFYKKSTYKGKQLFVPKPWFFGCWWRPLTPSRRPWESRGCLRIAEPRTTSPPQTLGWLWHGCQGAHWWWRWQKS